MKKLTCTQCGAGINNDTLTCEYCGSVFLSSNDIELENNTKRRKKKVEPELKFEVREQTNSELYTLCKNTIINTNNGSVFAIIFMFLWTGIAFSVLLSEFSFFPSNFGNTIELPFILVPSIFVVIGLSVIVNLISKLVKSQLYKELLLIQNGEHQKAYESLKTREQKNHNVNFVAIMILLDYFKLENYVEAKRLIIQMSPSELSSLIDKSSVFLEISQNLGVKTPMFDNTNFTGGGYTITM